MLPYISPAFPHLLIRKIPVKKTDVQIKRQIRGNSGLGPLSPLLKVGVAPISPLPAHDSSPDPAICRLPLNFSQVPRLSEYTIVRSVPKEGLVVFFGALGTYPAPQPKTGAGQAVPTGKYNSIPNLCCASRFPGRAGSQKPQLQAEARQSGNYALPWAQQSLGLALQG